MILAGDIGGTNCRLLACDDDGQAILQKVYPSRAYPRFADVLKAFFADFGHSGQAFRIGCFGLPGPVLAGRCRLTNLDWQVDADELAAETNIGRVYLLNDLAANAYGILTLKPEELLTVNAGQPLSQGNKVVLAPGTGLGEAGLIFVEGRPVAIATEGGHTDFGPTNELELELCRYALRRYKLEVVTYEMLISGPGLENIHAFLRDRTQSPVPAWLAEEMAHKDPSAAISQAALSGRDPICVLALELFVDILAGEAANMALKFLATGGVYLGGGIPPRICQKFLDPRFMRRFTNKDRLEWLLPRVPVYVIMNDRAALQGALAYAVQTVRTAAAS